MVPSFAIVAEQFTGLPPSVPAHRTVTASAPLSTYMLPLVVFMSAHNTATMGVSRNLVLS